MKERKPLVTIIIPAYNMQDYVLRSIRSAAEQTYRELEILVIDDGSGDATAELVQQAAKEDARIRFYHKENGGLSSARNAALDRMQGSYYVFLDSDDWLEKNAVERLMALQMADEAAMIVSECAYASEDENGELVVKRRSDGGDAGETVLSAAEGRLDLSVGRYCLQSVCQKLFSTERTGHLRFDEAIRQGEDRPYMYQCLLQCERVHYIPDALWVAYVRPGSLSRGPLSMRWMQPIEGIDRMIEQEPDAQVAQSFQKYRMEQIILYIGAYISRDSEDEMFYQALRRLAREGMPAYKKSGITFRERLAADFYTRMPAGLIRTYLRLRGKEL